MSAPTTVEWLRAAAGRVYTGSGRLALHLSRRTIARARRIYEGLRGWVGESSGGVDKAFRFAVLAVGVLIVRKSATAIGRWAYERIESGAWGPALFTAAGLWIVAAYRAGRPGWEPKHALQAAESPDAPVENLKQLEETPEPTSAVSLEKPSPPTFHQLCESLARVGTPHAHVAALAEDLGTTADLVREALDRCNVTVEPVRMRGRGSSTGIKGDALPTPRPPSDGVVAAGQPANNNDNNAFTTVPDKDNPVRTHVVWNTGQPTD